MWILVFACFAGALTGFEPRYRLLMQRLRTSHMHLPSTTKLLALVGIAGTIPGITFLAAIGGAWAANGNGFERPAAIAVLIVFGFIMLSMRPARWMSTRISEFGDGLMPMMTKGGKSSVFASLICGSAIGLNWVAYSAPVLGLTLASAALDEPNLQVLVIAAYAMGAMTGVALAALTAGLTPIRVISTLSKRLGQTMGVAVLSAAAAISLQYDTGFVTALSSGTPINLESEIDFDVTTEKRPGADINQIVETSVVDNRSLPRRAEP